MTNLSKSDFDNELLATVISQSRHSITVIRKAYIELSKNLIEVMDRIEDIMMLENYDENDRKYIQRRDCSFTEFKLIEKDVQIHGNNLLANILEATLDSALERSVVFFDSPNNNDWHKESQNLKIRLLKINADTTYLLEVVNTLNDTFNKIYNAFEPNYIKDLKRRYKYIDFEDGFKFKFDFSLIHYQLNLEPNLIKRKNGYFQVISERDLLSVKSGFNPSKFYPNIEFKNKCLQAIQFSEN